MTSSVIDHGGEGLILRLPSSPYIHGRSSSLLKLKASRVDKEALVIEVMDDIVVLQNPDGSTFEISDFDSPSFSSQLTDPYPRDHTTGNTNLQKEKVREGDVVTYSYESMSVRAQPVNAKITRVRHDLDWREVLRAEREASLSPSTPLSLNEVSREAMEGLKPTKVGEESKAFGYWSESKRNMRQFCERFAKDRDRDPLIPDHWYSSSRSEFINIKGGRSILAHYKGSLVKALMDLFPDIGIEESKFDFVSRHFWANIDNRRQVFIDYAQDNKFDPYVATNWYSVTSTQLKQHKSTGTMLSFYSGSVVQALFHLFPEIGLKANKFVAQPRKYYIDQNNRKEFIRFARANAFEPLAPENWYTQSKENLLSMKGSSLILQYYEGSFITALKNVFPDIVFNPTKFVHFNKPKRSERTVFPKNHWQKASNRRQLFEKVARERGFNPLVPENWYSIPPDAIMSFDGAPAVLFYYKGSIVRALVDLFPEVNFDQSLFRLMPRKHWLEEHHKQKILKFADNNKIDPSVPDSWYNIVSRSSIKSIPGISNLLSHYKGSFVRALMHIFPQLSLDPRKFHLLPVNHLNRDHKRTFFEKFAFKSGFDPLIASNWYSVPENTILENTGLRGIVDYYGNVGKTLMLLFPDVNFNANSFQTPMDEKKKDLDSKNKAVLVRCAKENAFDPLVADDWYKMSKDTIINSRGVKSVLAHFKGSLPAALLHNFPNIGLKRELLFSKEKIQEPKKSRDYTEEVRQRKQLFEELAASMGFDPLLPRNWYNISLSSISSYKGMPAVLLHYGGNPAKALLHLFPDIGLERQILSKKRH